MKSSFHPDGWLHIPGRISRAFLAIPLHREDLIFAQLPARPTLQVHAAVRCHRACTRRTQGFDRPLLPVTLLPLGNRLLDRNGPLDILPFRASQLRID